MPAVGLILFSAQQTGALWSDTETLPGATITAGTLDIGVGAGSFTLGSFGQTGLAVGGYSQTPLTVKNTGDVPTRYRLTNVTQSDAALPLTLTVWEVANESACPASGDPTGAATQLYDGNMIGASTELRPALQAGASTVLCLRGTVGTGAGGGLASTTTFTFDASQV
ncbi:hypothetical protein [Prescottella sp. R16]|uniref:hypothetical protein n=1 Tax=Prescottella sp. R16 TaxID=3064529 RepID=UPI00272E5A20|nr:hypothetical protein [Prescottella sp. R16]